MLENEHGFVELGPLCGNIFYIQVQEIVMSLPVLSVGLQDKMTENCIN